MKFVQNSSCQLWLVFQGSNQDILGTTLRTWPAVVCGRAIIAPSGVTRVGDGSVKVTMNRSKSADLPTRAVFQKPYTSVASEIMAELKPMPVPLAPGAVSLASSRLRQFPTQGSQNPPNRTKSTICVTDRLPSNILEKLLEQIVEDASQHSTPQETADEMLNALSILPFMRIVMGSWGQLLIGKGDDKS